MKVSLTKAQIRFYKPLLISKIEGLGLKDEQNQVPTGHFKPAQMVDPETNKVKRVNAPTMRISNPQRNLLKKLLKLSVEEVEHFLNTNFNKKEDNNTEEQETK